MSIDLVSRKLTAWKDALIDLTRQNPLLSLPKRSIIHLIDSPDSLWKLPIQGNKRLCFVAEKVPGTDISRNLKQNERAVDPATFRTLNNLRLKARLSLNEQGVNSLFVAIGVLEWNDPKLGTIIRSPLLLLPVTLERTPEGDGFFLARFEEEPRLNPTLRFRLSRPDVNVTLPDTEEGMDDDFSPANYLGELAELLQSRPGWTVHTEECLLGRFSFLNLVMYEELDQRLNILRRHPLVASIAGDSELAAELHQRETQFYPETPLPDTEPPQMAFHVLPADPSQEKAILAARYGRSIVIQGPPGTGKTQTITNLIATCIADGKKVLFVSEKMAALEAVYKRLEALGLADLCLEAHSHKAGKHEILEQLRRALEEKIRVTKVNPAEISVMVTLRDDLHQAVEHLHRPRDPLGISVYEARGRVASLSYAPEIFFALDHVEETDNDLFHHQVQLARRLATFHDLFEQAESHPWYGIKADFYTQELLTRVRNVVSDLLRNTDSLQSYTEALWECLGLTEVSSESLATSDSDWLLKIVTLLKSSYSPPVAWFTSTEQHLTQLRELAVSNRSRSRDFIEQRATLLQSCKPEILALPHSDLLHRLTEKASGLLAPCFGNGWADTNTDTFQEAQSVCARLEDIAHRFLQVAAHLAIRCGLTAPQTLNQAKSNNEVIKNVLVNPNPLPHWLALETHSVLAQKCKEAKNLHQSYRKAADTVASTYSDLIYQTELTTLQSRFEKDYASFTRIFKGQYYKDRSALAAVLQPGQDLKGRNIAQDLQLAAQAHSLNQELTVQKESYRDAFGARYQGEATDWTELRGALESTHAILSSLQGKLPARLQEILLNPGVAISELQEQYQLALQVQHTLEQTLAEAAAQFRIPGADTQPVVLLSLETLQGQLKEIRESLGDFMQARNLVQATQLSGPSPIEALRTTLRKARDLETQFDSINQESSQLQADFAHHFQGLETDWDQVLTTLDYAEQMRRLLSEKRQSFTEVFLKVASGSNSEQVFQAAQYTEKLNPLLREQERISLELMVLFDPLSFPNYEAQREWAEIRMGALSQLERWLAFQGARRECEKFGLLSFSEVILRRRPSAELIPDIFAKAFYQRWLDAVVARNPILNTLTSVEYTPHASSFVRLDKQLISMNASRVKTTARDRRELVQSSTARSGEAAYLQRILNQKRPRASVRKILAEIPNLLFKLKPCLMMSPLSVSLFLDPDRVRFDIVIFDEASQIFPEYALGPLLRADQAVIAGDSKQLPPTSFFKGMQDSDGEEDDEIALATDAREFESILDASAAALSKDREFYLTWHYRSKHESLIDFSRRHFYESRLSTFPSARQATAISFEYVPDAIYYGGAGKLRNNPVEAAQVAILVENFVRKHPERSVGVITMSEAQRDCIRTAIEERTRRDSTLATLLNEDKPDGFFIKNIENVQGDERDAIFFSLGYGKWEDGRARMLFGPINRDGGKRRLNVAVTRAREHITVVSSLLPEEIRLGDTTSEGVKLLQEYLSYARSSAQITHTSQAECNDLFVESVALALEERGYKTHRHVGLSEYRVDLAVCDPENPDTFLLGIECDSEHYQSGETIRARDWLRAEVLKNLGWRLYRLWSADWVRDLAKAIEALEKAISQPDALEITDPESVPAEGKTQEAFLESPVMAQEPQPSFPDENSNELWPGLSYFLSAENLALSGGADTLYSDYKESVLARAEFVRLLVQTEGPVSHNMITSRLCKAAGLSRAGNQIRRITNEAVTLLQTANVVEVRGEFVWPSGMEVPPARVPTPGQEPRPIEEISPEELERVVYFVLQHGIGMRLDELIRETSRALGFGTTGSAIRERLEAAIGHLEIGNQIHNFNGQLRTFETG